MSGQNRALRKGERRKLSNFENEVNRPPQNTSWTWVTSELLESPAWRCMSGSEHRIVDRLMAEHCRQGGQENGRLAVSYDAFVAYGVDRGAIKQALTHLDELGLVKTAQSGRRAYGADQGRVAIYRLTWLGVLGDHDRSGHATNEWRAVSEEQAKAMRRPKRPSTRTKEVKLRLVA